ncbi:MAG: sigma factor-like helix-turn-helix DNA-binding protein [Myxococcaceae bacterium]
MGDRDLETLTRGGREDSAALEQLWSRVEEYPPSSDTEDSWQLAMARIEDVEPSRSGNAREGLERARPPFRSEMHIAGETDDGRRVRRALASISAEQRTAVEWAYWDGLSPTEIGERTDLPVESVNKRLELALLKLGDLLSRD